MTNRHFIVSGAAAVALFISSQVSFAAEPEGYTDTPIIPGTKWHVHDPARPRPHIVTTGATFSHNAPAPSDATVLFDGTDLSKWKSAHGTNAAWKVENGYMEAVKGKGNIHTSEEFGDFQLHIEFATPEQVVSNSQGRGNSGIFLHGIYEVQVLDSYNNKTYADGQCGAMYGQYPPLASAEKKPGEWSSYDIIFEGPRFDGEGKVTRKAAVTIILNGVLMHHHQEYMGPTTHKQLTSYAKVKKTRGPIELQDHGNPMRFRNIWIRPLGEYDKQ